MLPREYFVWHTFSILFSPSPPSFRRTEIVKSFKSNPNLYLIWSPELSTWHSHNVWLTLDSWSNQLWITNLLKRIIKVIVYYRFIYCWFFILQLLVLNSWCTNTFQCVFDRLYFFKVLILIQRLKIKFSYTLHLIFCY